MIPAKDISRWQGNWQDTGEPIVMIKMGGGDAGLYMDSMASQDYNGAVKAGRAVGGYWFAGWGDPIAEASYFLRCMAPLAENDVYALDAEAIPAGVNPVAWSQSFINHIYDAIGVWCLIYMNFATLKAYNWDSVLTNSGLWLADWAVSPNDTIPTNHTYVMQQYSDGPSYDHDEWFGTIDQFKAYGWRAAKPAPVSAPSPTPAPAPAPVTVTATPTPVVSVTTTNSSLPSSLPVYRLNASVLDSQPTQAPTKTVQTPAVPIPSGANSGLLSLILKFLRWLKI